MVVHLRHVCFWASSLRLARLCRPSKTISRLRHRSHEAGRRRVRLRFWLGGGLRGRIPGAPPWLWAGFRGRIPGALPGSEGHAPKPKSQTHPSSPGFVKSVPEPAIFLKANTSQPTEERTPINSRNTGLKRSTIYDTRTTLNLATPFLDGVLSCHIPACYLSSCVGPLLVFALCVFWTSFSLWQRRGRCTTVRATGR